MLEIFFQEWRFPVEFGRNTRPTDSSCPVLGRTLLSCMIVALLISFHTDGTAWKVGGLTTSLLVLRCWTNGYFEQK